MWHRADKMLQEIKTKKLFNNNYIGDHISVRGRSYRVTGNYPRHGYLLGVPTKPGAGPSRSVKIFYGGEH